MWSSGIRKWCNSRHLQIMGFSVEVLLWFLVSTCWLQSAWLGFNTPSLFLCRPLSLLKADLFRTVFKIFLQDFALKKTLLQSSRAFYKEREVMNCSVLQVRFFKIFKCYSNGNWRTRCFWKSLKMLNRICRCFNKFVPSGLPKVQLVTARELKRGNFFFTAVAINHFCFLSDKVMGKCSCL